MANFNFETQGSNTYLVYQVGATDQIDSMSMGMITNNKIPGIAQTIFTQLDADKFLKYNISAKIPVNQFFAGAVNRKRLIGVFKGIADAMIAAEDYMLDPNTLLLDLEYIYADVSTCETVLICLPIANVENQNQDLASFFKNIMFTTQFDPTESSDHVAKILNFLNGSPVFSITEFKKVLNEIENPGMAQQQTAPQAPVVNQQPTPKSAVQTPVVPPVQPPVQTPPQVQPPVVPPVAPPVVPQVVPPKQENKAPAIPPMNIPGKPAPQQAETPPEDDGEKISLMYLMQHYNKENAAKYKAQKENKSSASAEKPKKEKQKGGKTPPPPPQGFAVPGAAPNNAGFAIPGAPAQPPVVPPAPAGVPVPPKPAGVPVPPQPPVQPAVPQGDSAEKGKTGKGLFGGVKKPDAPQAQPVAPAPFIPRDQIQGQQSLNFGETTVLGGGGAIGETTVLVSQNVQTKPLPHLIRKKNNEKIDLNKPVFRIGKEKSYVDYFIGDNTAISRSHANVINRDGTFVVVDTNSTNHTFVNGKMLQANEEVAVAHGDTVRLANEDFEFRLY